MPLLEDKLQMLDQHAKEMDSKMDFTISLINTLGATINDRTSEPARATQPTFDRKTSAFGMSDSPTCPPYPVFDPWHQGERTVAGIQHHHHQGQSLLSTPNKSNTEPRAGRKFALPIIRNYPKLRMNNSVYQNI